LDGVDIKVGLFVTSQQALVRLGALNSPFNRAYTFRFVIPAHHPPTFFDLALILSLSGKLAILAPMPGWLKVCLSQTLVSCYPTYTLAPLEIQLVSLLREYPAMVVELSSPSSITTVQIYQSSTLISNCIQGCLRRLQHWYELFMPNDRNQTLLFIIITTTRDGNVVLALPLHPTYITAMYSRVYWLPVGFLKAVCWPGILIAISTTQIRRARSAPSN
jgi:hypothetical protein